MQITDGKTWKYFVGDSAIWRNLNREEEVVRTTIKNWLVPKSDKLHKLADNVNKYGFKRIKLAKFLLSWWTICEEDQRPHSQAKKNWEAGWN